MTHRLPPPPFPEPPASRDLALLAPLFGEKVFTLLRDLEQRGHDPIVFEAFRSDERQDWLYRLNREFDDGQGRGIVTQAPDGRKSWHRFGLAVDIISKAHGWEAPGPFWLDLRRCATRLLLVSGDDWNRNGIPVEADPDEHYADRPHVQWWCPGMHVTPSDHAWALLQSRGLEAVWQEVHAIFVPPHG